MIRLIDLLSEDVVNKILNKITDYPIEKFVDKFKDIAGDPKIQAALKAGTTDGHPTDEKVQFSEKFISVKNLIPTQNIIDLDKSLKAIITNQYNQLEDFLSNKDITVSGPIVTLNAKWIIDGHHRWSQLYVANPEVNIKAVDFRSTLHPENMLKAVHMAIAADIGNVPLSNATGYNMLEASEETIKSYVKKNTVDSVLPIYAKYKKISKPDINLLADYIWNNVQTLQTKNKPKAWAPDRNVMPQTDNSDQYSKFLSQGIVNFIEPKSSDIK